MCKSGSAIVQRRLEVFTEETSIFEYSLYTFKLRNYSYHPTKSELHVVSIITSGDHFTYLTYRQYAWN
jgi:hypothetical protein